MPLLWSLGDAGSGRVRVSAIATAAPTTEATMASVESSAPRPATITRVAPFACGVTSTWIATSPAISGRLPQRFAGFDLFAWGEAHQVADRAPGLVALPLDIGAQVFAADLAGGGSLNGGAAVEGNLAGKPLRDRLRADLADLCDGGGPACLSD